MLAAPEYGSPKSYEWSASGAGFAAASEEKLKGSHSSFVVQEQQGSHDSLHGGYGGEDQTADWKKKNAHTPAISKASAKRLLQSSLDHLYDIWETTQVKFQSLVDFLQDSWFLEIGACVTALVLFIAEIVVLRVFEKNQVGTWPWSWSLNSAVALVTTLIEANLVFALTSCLGQMKWLWFSLDQGTTKPLIWVDLIARSNTPLGALSLLLRPTTWRSVRVLRREKVSS